LTLVTLFCLFGIASAHGAGHDTPIKEGETPVEYAQRHMAAEHHIDAFDLNSFFSLHDLDSNGFLDASEIEAIYGVHHTDSQKKSANEEAHAAKARIIVAEVLKRMDKNGDGILTMEEFSAAGFSGLPDFSSLGAEGHHYDEESEFFLHHEEVYHSTPETQTDEAYNHAEDIEHFEHHDRIELVEENKERKFQGLPPLAEGEVPSSHDHDHESEPASPPAHPIGVDDVRSPSPKYTRLRDAPTDPKDKFKGVANEAFEKPGWGLGDDGFKRPKTPAEKMRRNTPYKYKFKRNWGDF